MTLIRLRRPYKMDSVVGDANEVVDTDPATARALVDSGDAVFEGEQQTPMLPIPVVKREDGIEFPEQPQIVEVPEDFGESEESEDAIAKRPYGNATKAAWVRYAIALDENLSEAAATAMTKADLMSRYGERL